MHIFTLCTQCRVLTGQEVLDYLPIRPVQVTGLDTTELRVRPVESSIGIIYGETRRPLDACHRERRAVRSVKIGRLDLGIPSPIRPVNTPK